MFKKCLGLLVFPVIAIACQAQIGFNAGIVSDYIWRGVTQTNHDPAIQGGIDWAHRSGFYLGTWASNVSFDGDTDVEVDFYAGGVIPVTENLSFDLGYMRYEYIDSDFADEAYLGMHFNHFVFKYSKGLEISSNYLEGEWSMGLPHDFGLTLHFARFEFSGQGNTDYSDWSICVDRQWKGLDWKVAFTDTDMNNRAADARVFLSVLKSW